MFLAERGLPLLHTSLCASRNQVFLHIFRNTLMLLNVWTKMMNEVTSPISSGAWHPPGGAVFQTTPFFQKCENKTCLINLPLYKKRCLLGRLLKTDKDAFSCIATLSSFFIPPRSCFAVLMHKISVNYNLKQALGASCAGPSGRP